MTSPGCNVSIGTRRPSAIVTSVPKRKQLLELPLPDPPPLDPPPPLEPPPPLDPPPPEEPPPPLVPPPPELPPPDDSPDVPPVDPPEDPPLELPLDTESVVELLDALDEDTSVEPSVVDGGCCVVAQTGM